MNPVAWAFLAPAIVIGCVLLAAAARKGRSMWRHRRARQAAKRIYLYRGEE